MSEYRLLKVGEKVQVGDEFKRGDEWIELDESTIDNTKTGMLVLSHGDLPVRRKIINDSEIPDRMFKIVKTLDVITSDKGELCYLIPVSRTATSNGEHFKHDFNELIHHFCTILSKKELKEMTNEMIDKL